MGPSWFAAAASSSAPSASSAPGTTISARAAATAVTRSTAAVTTAARVVDGLQTLVSRNVETPPVEGRVALALPDNALARRFRDAAGLTNQRLARAARKAR